LCLICGGQRALLGGCAESGRDYGALAEMGHVPQECMQLLAAFPVVVCAVTDLCVFQAEIAAGRKYIAAFSATVGDACAGSS